MLSLCASAENIGRTLHRSSKERLQSELAARDAIIEALRRQMEFLQTLENKRHKKKRKYSLIQSISRRFSLFNTKSKDDGNDKEYECSIVVEPDIGNGDKMHAKIDNECDDLREKPKAKSCSELSGINNALLYASVSLWHLQTSTSTLMPFNEEPEYTYEEFLSAQSHGSTNLDNEGCLLVYGCPKELVSLLKPDIVGDRQRRWMLRSEYIEAINQNIISK
jgi:hypothetical protein